MDGNNLEGHFESKGIFIVEENDGRKYAFLIKPNVERSEAFIALMEKGIDAINLMPDFIDGISYWRAPYLL